MRARSERSSVSGQVTSSHVPLGFIFSRLIILSGSNGPAATDKTRQKPSAMARLVKAIFFIMMLPSSIALHRNPDDLPHGPPRDAFFIRNLGQPAFSALCI